MADTGKAQIALANAEGAVGLTMPTEEQVAKLSTILDTLTRKKNLSQGQICRFKNSKRGRCLLPLSELSKKLNSEQSIIFDTNPAYDDPDSSIQLEIVDSNPEIVDDESVDEETEIDDDEEEGTRLYGVLLPNIARPRSAIFFVSVTYCTGTIDKENEEDEEFVSSGSCHQMILIVNQNDKTYQVIDPNGCYQSNA